MLSAGARLLKGIREAKLKLYGTANGLKKGIRFANAILVTPPRPSPRGEGVRKTLASAKDNLQRCRTFLKGIRFANAIIAPLPCPSPVGRGR